MRKFRFRLQRVERLRAQQERLARLALAERVQRQNQLDAERQRLEADLEACAVAREEAAPLAGALADGLGRTLARVKHDKLVADSAVEAARGKWSEARRDLRTLEMLRARREAEWRTARRRTEQAEMDEIARMRFARARDDVSTTDGPRRPR